MYSATFHIIIYLHILLKVVLCVHSVPTSRVPSQVGHLLLSVLGSVLYHVLDPKLLMTLFVRKQMSYYASLTTG